MCLNATPPCCAAWALGSRAVCDTLKAYEKYYFGLRYVDTKGDEDWVKLEKKILKHIFPKVAKKKEERGCF